MGATERSAGADASSSLWGNLYSTNVRPEDRGRTSWGGEPIGGPVPERWLVAGASAGATGLAGAEVVAVDVLPAAEAAAIPGIEA